MSGTKNNPTQVKKRMTRNSNRTTIDDIKKDRNSNEIYYDNSKEFDDISVNIAFQETQKKRTKTAVDTDKDILLSTELQNTTPPSPLSQPHQQTPTKTLKT